MIEVRYITKLDAGPTMTANIVVDWSDDDTAYVAHVFEWPSLATHGATPGEAIDEMLQVLREETGE